MIACSAHRGVKSGAIFLPLVLAALVLPSAVWAQCPVNAVSLPVGKQLQPIVDANAPGTTFCIKAGVHRLQAIRPKSGQKFFGEPGAILSGARVLTRFEREGRYWVAADQFHRSKPVGSCLPAFPGCSQPESLFIDNVPLIRVVKLADVKPGRFFIDYDAGRLYFVDDPTNKVVETGVARFAFDSTAENVNIENLVVEKYISPAQEAAINGRRGKGWRVVNVEARWNSGVAIAVGNAGSILGSNVHDNGQLGLSGLGTGIEIARNRIWNNNIYGFHYDWEAGGVKVAYSSSVVMRENVVYGNNGPGLWCDIDCRNVLYEKNIVEYNEDAGIYHEISYDAVIRGNVSRFNGMARKEWYWGGDITISASENVQVHNNVVGVRPNGNAIVLVDQNRSSEKGVRYKTRGNNVSDNEVTFEGDGSAGGASDANSTDENYGIIEKGRNTFSGNSYRLRPSANLRFVWGDRTYDWDQFRSLGQETKGKLIRQ